MLLFWYKMEQAYKIGFKQGFVQGFALGLEQGRAEVYQKWHADWEKRRQAAAEKGLPFNDPPPPNPENRG